MRALTFRQRMEEAGKAAPSEHVDPWRLRLDRVRGKIDFFDKLERVSSQTLLDFPGSSSAQSNGCHVSTPVKVDGRAWLECSPRPRPDARRIQRASEGLLPRRSGPAVHQPLLNQQIAPNCPRCWRATVSPKQSHKVGSSRAQQPFGDATVTRTLVSSKVASRDAFRRLHTPLPAWHVIGLAVDDH
jgi:hypothetical protein